jgi:hypothetical protein
LARLNLLFQTGFGDEDLGHFGCLLLGDQADGNADAVPSAEGSGVGVGVGTGVDAGGTSVTGSETWTLPGLQAEARPAGVNFRNVRRAKRRFIATLYYRTGL